MCGFYWRVSDCEELNGSTCLSEIITFQKKCFNNKISCDTILRTRLTYNLIRRDQMNICIVSTYSCTFEDFSAVVDEYEETFKEFITEFELVKVNDHKFNFDVPLHRHGSL